MHGRKLEIADLTRDALAAKKARGEKLGNPANLTRTAQKKGSQATKAKALAAYSTLAASIVAMKDGGQSFRQIADILNERGEVTSTGAKFVTPTIKRIYDRAIAADASTVVPYGYRVKGAALVPVPAEIEAIRLARELRARDWTLQAIAEEFTRRGIPTRRGGRWHPTQIMRILEGR